ncbi:MAG TPA: DUF983 domain-containing protein [Bacteroidia bacterium]|jgi:rRNA maturation protein Nop10|nr:DUF983 domain-containing protein [Bacteroidia bacterium]
MNHDSIIYSILNQKCPRCHTGDLFLSKNPYNIPKIYAMPDNCPVCGQSFLPEVGFWWGSMYVSYGISVGLSVATVLFLWLVAGWSDWAVLSGNAVLMILILPLAFRYARSIWFHMFVKFDPKFSTHKSV